MHRFIYLPDAETFSKFIRKAYNRTLVQQFRFSEIDLAMQYLASFGLTAFLLLTGTTVVAENIQKSDNSHQYPEEFKQSYAQECIQTSMTEGLTEQEAQKLCNCTIDKFQSQYSLEEFQQLTTASRQDKKAETALVEVGQVCFEEILYEE